MIEKLYRQNKASGQVCSLRALCQLFEVNRAWYYQRQKEQAQHQQAENSLKAQVEALLLEFAGYGYRRVTKALQKAGVAIGFGRVLGLLRKWGLLCRPLKKKKLATTQSDPNAPYAENLLAPAKKAGQIEQPNRAWVGDVVYVITKREQGYLATLLDAYSRRVVGWAISRVNDTALTSKALNQAILSRKPGPGLIHHSDHGSNYTSADYQAALTKIGAKISHSRPGRPCENGMAESFNKTVSYEKLFLEEYATLAEAEAALANWLEPLYNRRRLHSSLDYQAPVEFEENWHKRQLELGLVNP